MVSSLESNIKNKWIQCRECDCFGHRQTECANTLKKKNKSLKATWSNRDSDYYKNDESNFIAFTTRSNVIGSGNIGASSGAAFGVSGGTSVRKQ